MAPDGRAQGAALADGLALRCALSAPSALRAPQGFAPGKPIGEQKKRKHSKEQKGDISNEVREGTFLKSFDTLKKSP